MRDKRLTFLLAIITCLGVGGFNSGAKADEVTEYVDSPPRYESVPELFLRAYTANSGDFFRSVDYEAQFNLIFGFNEFPENQITTDTEILHILSEDYQEHVTEGELIRTRDLPNPYESSLNENPAYLPPFTP